MLIGGLWMIVERNVDNSDAIRLKKITWIPRFVWFAGWLAIGVVSLWVGGRVLFGYA